MSTTFRNIVLHRGKKGFGMRIICDETKGVTRVSGIIEGGAASETGQIYIGDVIHEVSDLVNARPATTFRCASCAN